MSCRFPLRQLGVWLIFALLMLGVIGCRPKPNPELSLVWETWNIIKDSYLKIEDIDPEVVATTAAGAMFVVADKPVTSYLSRLSDVRGRPPREVPKEMASIWKAWKLLKRDAMGSDPELLADAAIRGMLLGMEDPEIEYLTPEEYSQARKSLEGAYEGIGAYMITDEMDRVVIAELIPGGPATGAGLQEGDVILKINGESMKGVGSQEVSQRIRGKSGEPVTLEVERAEEPEPTVITLVRGRVEVPTVDISLLPGGIGYMGVSRFQENTGYEFKSALERLTTVKPLAIVLDLRDNPGGSFESARVVVNEFLPNGIAGYEVDAKGKRIDWVVQEKGKASDLPMAVLVNQSTARAGEAVASALQETGRARVFGIPTSGYSTITSFRPLSNGFALHLTTARWYSPSGKSVGNKGLPPDVVVELTRQDIQADRDSQLMEAYRYLDSILPPFR